VPELPEAETIARDLDRRTGGAVVDRVEVLRPDILAPGLDAPGLDCALRGRRLLRVGRRGKNVLLELDGGIRLLINLGMTGRLVVSDAARAGGMRHVAARLHLADGRAILYDDARRFGRFAVYDAAGWAGRDAELGLEPLSSALTAVRLRDLLAASRTPIRTWLLDQRRLAGVGNIYALEALHRSGIHPAQPANTLTAAETARLLASLRAVLRESIRVRGTTFSDYRDGEGNEGAFWPLLRVYGREGEPCPSCGRPVRRLVLAQRSAYYCAACQPLRRRKPGR
jgi:formamidopyrimidine-DNA glycosylase